MKCPKCQADNPETQRFCGECGTSLIPQSKDLHPKVTETLQAPIQELTTGTTFANRYQITEELGKGGMGKVYKVFDQEVQAKMALKLIKPDVSADKNTIDRFRNELKIARDISHKNICRMYDLGREAGNYFITMEYVSGEDLKSFIRRSRQLVVGTAIFIAKQLCEGLAEAHRLGVVHRDLKPGNIMIDKEGNAKIMDFGIARTVSAKGITSAGIMIGTPEYMSPEQVEAKEVDQRSDIYSLGIILYEMLTGQVPFEGDTPFAVGMKQKSEIPIDPKTLNAQIPEDLDRLILKCLEKSKEKRYQSAEELRGNLEKIEKGVPTSERPVPKRKSVTSKPMTLTFSRKRLLIPISVIVLAALGGIIWFVLIKKEMPLHPEQRRSIAIISFKNQTGDPAYNYLSKVIPNLMISKLEQSKYFNVTTWERLRDLLKQIDKGDTEFINSDLGFELCQKEGIENLVLGMVSKSGNTFVTDAKVLQVGTKKLLATASSKGVGPDSILESQVDDLGRQVAEGVGLSERKFASGGGRIADMTTDSIEAYNYYIKGLEEWDKMNQAAAVQYFEKAVAIDPNFAMALSRLGGYLGGESLKKAMTKAMTLAKSVTEKERLYIEANYAFLIEKNTPKTVSIYRQIVEKYPNEKLAYFSLGEFAENSQEAVKMYRKALGLDPNFGNAWASLTARYLVLGQPDQAVDAGKKYVAARPGDANALDSLGGAYFIAGELDEALEFYKKGYDIDPSLPFGLGFGYIYAIREDYSQALEWIDRAIRSSTGISKPYNYLWRAFYLSWLGSKEKSLSNIQTAEDLSAALDFERGKALANRLRALVYYDSGEFELSQKHNKISFDLLMESYGSVWQSYHRSGYLFLEGLIDINEGEVESAKSRLTEMETISAGIDPGYWRKDITGFETEYLRNMILLRENSFEIAAASFEKAVLHEFATEWGSIDHRRFRYNTPFQRDVLARAYVEHEEIDKAIAEYERLITFDPTKLCRILIHPLYHHRLGILYEQKGMKDKARTQYERFLDFWKDADPDRPEPADTRKRLAALH